MVKLITKNAQRAKENFLFHFHEGDKDSLREAFKYFIFNVFGAGFIFVGLCLVGPLTPFNATLLTGAAPYIPHGAAWLGMSITNDWHSAHPESEKFDRIEQQTIHYVPCAHCGELMRPLPKKLAEKLYAYNNEIDRELTRRLCPKCRQIEDAKRNACLLPTTSGETESKAVTSAVPTKD